MLLSLTYLPTYLLTNTIFLVLLIDRELKKKKEEEDAAKVYDDFVESFAKDENSAKSFMKDGKMVQLDNIKVFYYKILIGDSFLCTITLVKTNNNFFFDKFITSFNQYSHLDSLSI